jgi:hypothetical protein
MLAEAVIMTSSYLRNRKYHRVSRKVALGGASREEMDVAVDGLYVTVQPRLGLSHIQVGLCRAAS